jgi:nitrogen fixation/metabolism regulation signal transduction histidine kinase
VLCGLLAIVPASLLWQCLRRLAPRMPRMENDAAAVAAPRELADAMLALEARLEHAPIALFRIEHASGAGAVAPLNASARRVLAPGRASTPQELHQLLAAQATGQRQLVSFDTERGAERALVAVSALTLQGGAQRLAALMPVESELEAEALNAWRELVQVLTHEIMNSLTPVASLSRTACSLLDEARDSCRKTSTQT